MDHHDIVIKTVVGLVQTEDRFINVYNDYEEDSFYVVVVYKKDKDSFETHKYPIQNIVSIKKTKAAE